VVTTHYIRNFAINWIRIMPIIARNCRMCITGNASRWRRIREV